MNADGVGDFATHPTIHATTQPELAAGDGALGFWKALDEVSPTTRHQCRAFRIVRRLIFRRPATLPAARALVEGPELRLVDLDDAVHFLRLAHGLDLQ
jgi:hypothetical protein